MKILKMNATENRAAEWAKLDTEDLDNGGQEQTVPPKPSTKKAWYSGLELIPASAAWLGASSGIIIANRIIMVELKVRMVLDGGIVTHVSI